MRIHRGFDISGSRRLLVLAAASVIAVGALLPVFAQPSRAGTGEVVAVRELQLKAGVDGLNSNDSSATRTTLAGKPRYRD